MTQSQFGADSVGRGPDCEQGADTGGTEKGDLPEVDDELSRAPGEDLVGKVGETAGTADVELPGDLDGGALLVGAELEGEDRAAHHVTAGHCDRSRVEGRSQKFRETAIVTFIEWATSGLRSDCQPPGSRATPSRYGTPGYRRWAASK